MISDNVKGKYLLTLKYKSATWFADSFKTKGGTITATQKIINSSKQNVAELGIEQNEFTIDGFIAASPISEADLAEAEKREDDYIDVRDEVIKVLNSPGRGTLTHPTFGVVDNVKAVSWSLDESSVSSPGIGKLSVKFVISNAINPDAPAILGEIVGPETFTAAFEELLAEPLDISAEVPGSELVELSFLQSLGLDALEAILAAADFVSGLISAILDSTIFTAIVSVVEAVSKAFDTVMGFVEFATDQIDKVSAIVSSFAATIGELAAIPGLLVASITNVFGVINSAVTSAISGFKAMTSFFSFGWVSDIDPFSAFGSGTKQSQAVIANTQNINTNVNCNALLAAYTQVTGLDMRTLDELDEIEATLDSQYEGIMLNGNLDLGIVQTVKETRDSMRIYLENRRLNAARVIEIDTRITSARTLSYRLYGTDFDSNNIADLNLSNGISMSGRLKVFSQ
tara:strand:+ start:6214 stop:7581 length:1368 start_codon:yes stop_codon:yes gene_type:complete